MIHQTNKKRDKDINYRSWCWLWLSWKNNLKGEQTQYSFGSALSSIWVESFLNYYVDNVQPPKDDVGAHEEDINPTDADFSGFIFKIQATMILNIVIGIAFLRVCSGEFNRNGCLFSENREN